MDAGPQHPRLLRRPKRVPIGVQGVTVDLPKLREAFATASPELQNTVSECVMGIRYSDYSRSLSALDKLANAPGITEPQKKIVSDVIEQVKALAGNAPAAPPR